jgi:hypothetical protein
MIFISDKIKDQLEEVLEILEDQVKLGNTGNNAEIYEARNKLKKLIAELGAL